MEAAICAALLTGLSGCISTVSVKHIDPDSADRGIRFSLPATMLLVQPQPDGSATYTWVYPPDPNKTYAIRQHNFLSKFNLDVTIANNLLAKANSQQDSTTLAAKLFDSAQSTFAAHATAQSTDDKTKTAVLTSAQTALASATLALKQAQEEQGILSTKGSADQKLAAELKVSDAKAAFAQAQATLAKLQSAGDVPIGSGPSTQWGPVLFAFVEDGAKHFHLQQVNVQVAEDTVVPAAAPAAPAQATRSLTADRPAYDHTAKPLVVTVTVTPAAAMVDRTSGVTDAKTFRQVTPAPKFEISDGKVIVTFKDGLPAGDYVINPALAPAGGSPTNPSPLTIHVK